MFQLSPNLNLEPQPEEILGPAGMTLERKTPTNHRNGSSFSRNYATFHKTQSSDGVRQQAQRGGAINDFTGLKSDLS